MKTLICIEFFENAIDNKTKKCFLEDLLRIKFQNDKKIERMGNSRYDKVILFLAGSLTSGSGMNSPGSSIGQYPPVRRSNKTSAMQIRYDTVQFKLR